MINKSKKMLVPSDIPQLLQPGRIVLLPGKIFVPPHGKLIWEGKKKAIVSSRLFKKYIGVPVYLIEGDKAYGIIQLKSAEEIDLKKFKELRKFHKVSDLEYEKWWKGKKTLYFYPVELISKFDPPKDIIRPEGAQVWLQSVSFKSIEFEDPSRLSDSALFQLHNEIHRVCREDGASKEECINYHILIKNEMLRRNFKHKYIDSLDTESRKFEERFSKEGYKVSLYGSKGLVEEEGPGHKFHTSVLYEYQGKKLLVDYGEKNQGNLDKIKPDYILNTHAHKDHLEGLKDMPVIISKQTDKVISELYKDFNIDASVKYESYKAFKIGPFKITPIPVLHSIKSPTHAMLIRMGDKKVLQATDILGWHAGDREKFVKDLDLAIIDGSSLTRTLVRRKEKGEPFGHASIQTQLKNWYTLDKVKRIIIAHLGKEPLGLGDEEFLAKARELTKVPITVANDHIVVNLSEGYAPVYSSGNKIGRTITLKEILPYFKPFKIQVPLVYLTGGLVNRRSTKGDIDLLLPAWLGSDMKRIIEFRIARSFPLNLRKRLHFVYDTFSTPFTNSLPLFDLIMNRSQAKVLRMSDAEKQLREKPRIAGAVEDAEISAKEDKIEMFRYFLPLKPTRGYYPEKRQTIELFIEVMEKSGQYPFYSTKKYDGMNAIFMSDGKKVEIYSEDGENITDRLPNFVKQLLELSKKPLIFMAEIEKWKESRHEPRESTAGLIHRKGVPDDTELVANVYDMPYFEKDIHNEPFEFRLGLLEKLPFKQKTFKIPNTIIKFNFAPYLISKNRADLRKHTEFLRKLPYSEGNVAKTKDFKFNLKGIRSGMVKYHNSTTIYGKVLEIKETKVKNIWNYYFGLEPGKYKMETEELGNEFYHRSGRTFSTSIKAKIGDVLEIEGETLNAEHKLKDDTWRISVWAPRLMGITERKVDTVQEAISRAKKNYCFQEKDLTAEGKIIYLSDIEKQQDPYLEYPKTEKKWKYVIQRHFRGAGHHIDIRFEQNDFLIGWTVADMLKGKPGKPILTLIDAKNLNQTEISKINWEKGVPKLRPGIKPGFKEKYAELAAVRKSREPKEWLNVQGVTPKGEVGATAEFPGVFQIIDKGFLERGASKSYFHEYFFSDGKLKGRWIFRQLRPKEFRGEVEKQEIIPPARETEFREESPWFMIKPLDETPYVLSKAAVNKKWIPSEGVSALPENVKKQVPEKFHYWKIQEEKLRIEARDELVKKKIIRLSEVIMKPYPREHSCRINPPKNYERFFRQNCKIKHKGKCISLVFGVKEGKSEVQSLRYPKNVWNASEARSHCKSKKGAFEPAKAVEKALNPGSNWARAAYRYILAQQQNTIWVTMSPEEKVARVKLGLDDFSKIKSFKPEYLESAIAWLGKNPDEIKKIMIQLLSKIEKAKKVKFVLQWHFFRGPKVIRAGVSREHWDLRMDFPEQKGLLHFVLDLNPLKNRELTSFIKPSPYKEWMNISQYLPPKNEREKMSEDELKKLPPGIEEANPTLNTPAFIKIIDKGTATVFEDSETFKKFSFSGKDLKGLWIFERENESEFWRMKRSELPKPV